MTRAGDKLYRDPETRPPREGGAALRLVAIVVLGYAAVRLVLTTVL